MPFTPTRFRKVTPFQDAHEKRVFHDVDQFQWYREGLHHARNPDSLDLWSEVMFTLPPAPKSRNQTQLTVVGTGIEECQAYLFGFKRGPTGQPVSAVWNLFDYQSGDEGGKLPLSTPTEYPPKFARVFTTEISPFLHVGDIPPEAHRIYHFQLFGSDAFQLRAVIGEHAKDDRLTFNLSKTGKINYLQLS